ncbi:MAG: NAD(P)H-quinone oxidoreductase [Chloroflexi bacterium]|nr:NAD(P)H-quinone oxidoreductase [Chloroflexota bacterium]MDA1145130.1 NAD(P)H-quinone oxidoreductase [Chloroflexota bacterium]
MQAAVITEPGGPEVFAIQEVADPTFGPEDALVSVHATALNRADLLQRMGRYSGPVGTRDDIPGLEMAGIVEAVGDRVSAWKPGDRVMALLGGGGYASKVAVHERLLMPVPPNIELDDAASIPEVFLTAYDALFVQCELAMGERVLIHAAGSGVGTAGIQLAAAQGCRVFGTAGSDDKLERAAELGLNVGINYHDADFADVITERTEGAGVQVVLDVIGAQYWEQNLRSLAVRGRMVIVGTMGGAKLEVNLGALMGKRLRVHGTVLRARPLEEKAALTQQFVARVLPLFQNETVSPVVDRVFPLVEVADAHRYMETNANFGKIVLRHDH